METKPDWDSIRSRGAWLAKWHNDEYHQIKAEWRDLWGKR